MDQFKRYAVLPTLAIGILFILAVICLGGEPTPAPRASAYLRSPELLVGANLQRVSVNVLCSPSGGSYGTQGSGTIFLCEMDDGSSTTWILTANHVVDCLRRVETISGSDKKIVRYRDAQIIQEQVDRGRAVGEIKYDAKVVSVDTHRDIALLRVRYSDFTRVGAQLYLGDYIPQPGTAIFHCGAPGGKDLGGTCSLTAGIISRLGVRIPDFGGGSELGIFDQTDTAALGGSSGGLIALRTNGQIIGIITLGLRSGDNFHWLVPARSIVTWATEVGAMPIFDASLPRPTEDELMSIPLEHRPDGTRLDGLTLDGA